jgi:NAD(P)H-quinone oxidoreductase subunit 5
MALCYFALHEMFVHAFADVLAPIPTTMAPEYAALTALVIATFLLLTWLQGPGRERLEPTRQMALFVHLYNGLYADLWIERLSYRLWPDKVGKRAHRFDLAVARTAPAALSNKP